MKNRDRYMKILLDFKDKNIIKVITGIRRSGKSTLLTLFRDNLLSQGVLEENIIRMNFESMEYEDIKDYKDLYNFVKSRIKKGNSRTYIILDEIQIVDKWEKAINSFMVDYNVDIYITGSNAFLLSSELATFLSGRYVEIKMLPLSFKEYIEFNESSKNISNDKLFEEYLKFGGMPAISEYKNNLEIINNVLEGLYSTVILKDVMQRNSISDQVLLEKIVMFLADNIGNITSTNNISNCLSNEGNVIKSLKNPASKTIDNYIKCLENAYIFYNIRRYDIKGKQYLKTLNKYYIVDTGIRNMLLGYRDMDRGHILENVVYFELKRRGYEVSIGKIGEKEIDFIAVKPTVKIYIQVTESLMGEEVRKREINPLKEIKDNYRKIVLSMDKNFINSDEGIEIGNIIDFLLEEK